MTVTELLHKLKASLQALYGNRLKSLILYGSEARGEAEPDSDIDLLAVLEGPVDVGREIRETVHATYPLQLETYRSIHIMPVNADDFAAGRCNLYREVQREGVPI
ncbi:MAG: nucleotidyltransferase domain-containing protein [bacterium]